METTPGLRFLSRGADTAAVRADLCGPGPAPNRSQLGRLPLVERAAQIDQAPPGGERVKRLLSGRRAGSGERRGGTQDEMRLTRIGRRPNLGHVAGGPSDGSRLGLWGASPGENEEDEQRVGERQLRKLSRRGHDDVGIARFHRPGEPGHGMALRRHLLAVRPVGCIDAF